MGPLTFMKGADLFFFPAETLLACFFDLSYSFFLFLPFSFRSEGRSLANGSASQSELGEGVWAHS